MNAFGIRYQRQQFGKVFVYYAFEYPPAEGESLLPVNAYALSSNIDQAHAVELMDGNLSKTWKVNEIQKTGQYVEVSFKQQQYVQRVDIVHPFIDPAPAKSVRILGRRGTIWVPLSGPVEFQADLLSFYNNHPVLGEFSQTIRFEPQWLDAVRIELVSPEPDKPWTLSEVRVGVLQGAQRADHEPGTTREALNNS